MHQSISSLNIFSVRWVYFPYPSVWYGRMDGVPTHDNGLLIRLVLMFNNPDVKWFSGFCVSSLPRGDIKKRD